MLTYKICSCNSQAALTVARRVAQEMGCPVGADVGYRVRFEERMSPSTRIVYLTGTGFATIRSSGIWLHMHKRLVKAP